MKMNSLITRILCAFSLIAMSSASHGGEITPQGYVAIDVAVREITLNGMAERVQLLSSGESTQQQEVALDRINRQQINQAYTDNGTTPATHAAYGSQHAEEVAAWLEANPEWQHQYELLADEFESLLNQLDALREGQ